MLPANFATHLLTGATYARAARIPGVRRLPPGYPAAGARWPRARGHLAGSRREPVITWAGSNGRLFYGSYDKDNMRHAVRIQPYISRDLFQKLRAYSAARSLTVSAVIGAALGEYLERNEVEDALLVRRLDGVTHAIGQLQRDLDTLAAGFGRFVRYFLYSAPTGWTPEVVRRGNNLYRDFLARVCEQLREGVRFTGQVWGGQVRPAVSAAVSSGGNGGREEGRKP